VAHRNDAEQGTVHPALRGHGSIRGGASQPPGLLRSTRANHQTPKDQDHGNRKPIAERPQHAAHKETSALGLPCQGHPTTILSMKRTAIALGAATIMNLVGAPSTGQAAAIPTLTPKQYAKNASDGLWRPAEWQCLEELWHRESRWNPKADNPRSSAYGIPQILGLDERLSPFQQIDAGIRYLLHRHETPCRALSFHNKRGWY